MVTEANVIYSAGSGDFSVNSPNMPILSDRENVTHGNIGNNSGGVGIIPHSQYKNKFSRVRSNDRKYGINTLTVHDRNPELSMSLSSIISGTPRNTNGRE